MIRAALIVVALAVGAGVAGAAAEQEPVRLPRPSFPGPAGTASGGDLRLTIVSSQRNRITDEAAWVARNRLDLREYAIPGSSPSIRFPRLPGSAPPSYRGLQLVRAIRQTKTLLLIYGRNFAEGRFLLATNRAGRVRYAFDFQNYRRAPGTTVFQELVWAAEASGTLYVAHTHSGGAAYSRARNAYVTAINLATRKVRWRSPALVENARRFEVLGRVIVTGYGWTGEPDFLYLLDRRTGKVVDREAMPTAPDYIVRKGSRLYVRTYDHDIVLKLTRA